MKDDHKSLRENLELFLNSSNHCALIDSARGSNAYRSELPIWVAEFDAGEFGLGRLNRKLFEFDSRGLSSGLIISQLIEQSTHSKKAESNLQLLCEHIKAARPALIVIHQCSELPSKTVQFLSNITAYLKRSNSDWKILYLGNLRELSPTAQKLYLPDAIYPSISEHSNSSDSGALIGKSISLLLVAASVGLLLWLFADKNFDADRVESPLAEKIEHSNERQQTTLPSNVQSDSEITEIEDWKDHVQEFEMMMAKYSDKVVEQPAVLAQAPLKKAAKSERTWSTQSNLPSKFMHPDMLNAVKAGDTETLKKAINTGSDINSVTAEKLESALIIAATEGHQSLATWLIDNDANINQLDSNSRSALFYASVNGHIEVARKLLKKGAKPNSITKLKKTPLMAAVHNNHFELSRLLIDAKSDINHQDHSGWSALFYAVWNKNQKLTELLVSRGGKPELRDKEGYTAVDIAKAKGATGILPILTQ